MSGLGDVVQRLAANRFVVDDAHPHLEVDQEAVRATGTGPLLCRVCPAGVYAERPDGTIAVDFAACLECGACAAVAAPGSLTWRYPRGGAGVQYRQG